MKRATISIFALMLILGPDATALLAQRQLKYDVKTRAADTLDLQLAKRGVVAVFNGAPTARVVNTGEDYAVWLSGIDRFVDGDVTRVVVHVDITKPAMVWRKDRVLQSLTPSFSYNRRRLIEYANANISEADLRTTNADFGSVSQRVATMLRQGSSTTTMNVAVSGVLVSGLVVGLAETIRGNPSPVQIAESLYVGQVVLDAVETSLGNRAR